MLKVINNRRGPVQNIKKFVTTICDPTIGKEIRGYFPLTEAEKFFKNIYDF